MAIKNKNKVNCIIITVIFIIILNIYKKHVTAKGGKKGSSVTAVTELPMDQKGT